MIIVGCSNSRSLAKKIGEKLNFDYEDLQISNSVDGEMHLQFKNDLKNKTVVLVQSLYPHPNHSLIEVLFAAASARDLGAKKIILVAPYLAYLREDSRKVKGECISSKVISELINRNFDVIMAVEPHIHSNLRKFFSIPFYKIEVGELLKEYVKKNFKNAIIIGADESIRGFANKISRDVIILKKKRKDEFNVFFEKLNHGLSREKEVLIVDDVIVTGKTMIEAIKSLKLENVKCLVVHSVMIEGSRKEIGKYCKDVISCNTVYHDSNQIDVSGAIAAKLMGVR